MPGGGSPKKSGSMFSSALGLNSPRTSQVPSASIQASEDKVGSADELEISRQLSNESHGDSFDQNTSLPGMSSQEIPALDESNDILGSSEASIATVQRIGEQDMSLMSAVSSHTRNTRRRRLYYRHANEKWYHTTAQLVIPITLAGLCMVVTGYYLHKLIETEAFNKIPELTQLYTPLLGLKGNIEVMFVTNLCTLVNLGELDTTSKKVSMILQDIALSQVQAVIAGFLASVFAVLLTAAQPDLPGSYDPMEIDNIVVIVSSSILTASLASLILGLFMTLVVFSTDNCQVNPDNIATPLVTASGELVTLGLFAGSSQLMYYCVRTPSNAEISHLIWVPSVIIGFYFLVILPTLGYVAYKDKHTRKNLFESWVPLTVGLAISSAAGMLFALENHKFSLMSFYHPVIVGVGFNLVCIQYNRISTVFHRDAKMGNIPAAEPGGTTDVILTPYQTFRRLGYHSTTAIVLTVIAVPSHLLNTAIIVAIIPNQYHPCFGFFIAPYLILAFLQIIVLLCLAPTFINILWKKKIDPTSYVIPFLSAISDILGTVFLCAVFEIVHWGDCRLPLKKDH